MAKVFNCMTLLATFLLVLNFSSFGQNKGYSESPSEYQPRIYKERKMKKTQVDRAASGSVVIPVSLYRNGKSLKSANPKEEFSKNDFELLVDGEPRNFQFSKGRTPKEYLIFVDTSPSLLGFTEKVISFVSSIIDASGDEDSVRVFKVAGKIKELKRKQGKFDLKGDLKLQDNGTRIYGISKKLEKLSTESSKCKTGDCIVILLTDGVDTVSGIDLRNRWLS